MRHWYTRCRVVRTASVGSTGLFLAGCGGSQLASGPPTQAPVTTGTGPATAVLPTRAAALEGPVDYSAMFAKFEPADEPNGDLAKVVWPQWLLELDPEIKQL